MTRRKVLLCSLVMSLTYLTSYMAMSQDIGDRIVYSVIPSCESPDPSKPTLRDQYFLKPEISGLSDRVEDDIEIIVDRTPFVQLHIDTSELPFTRFVGPFIHSGVGGTFKEYIVRSLSDGIADTLFLPEVVCGFSTSNGLDNAGFYCEDGLYGLVAQVTPEIVDEPLLPDKTYLYILVESESLIIVDRNFSGHFVDIDDLSSYELHAYAIPFEEQASFLNDVIIGTSFDEELFSICFATCGVFDVLVDCSSFDLSLQKRVQGGFIYEVGDEVIFEIEVINDGNVVAYDIVVTDMLPLGLDFLPSQNPGWTEDLTSSPIDSLLPGESVVLPIVVRVNEESLNQEVINVAEITFATNTPGHDISAFDVDSSPDNNDSTEDDIDDAEITILQSLCAATFDITAQNEAVCLGGPISMAAELIMATQPVRYIWRFGDEVVSRDSLFVIESHVPSDYGIYSLTIIDGNGCAGTEFVEIEPIDDQERFACFNDINVGVNNDCEIRLSPLMFTSRDVSGLRDYDIIIRDPEGIIVDQSDLTIYPPGTVLEAQIINPCTGEVICWSRLHIENKLDPSIDIYGSEQREIVCTALVSDEPTAVIDRYNELFDEDILDAQMYADSFNQLVCLQEWEVQTSDLLIVDDGTCFSQSVWRVYSVFDQERILPVDTVSIEIVALDLADIQMPGDISNLDCTTGLSAQELGSFPSYSVNGTNISIENITNGNRNAICNIAVTYADETLIRDCKFGATRIERTWAISDWCSDRTITEVQHLFVRDHQAPVVVPSQEDIRLVTAPFACFATLDIREYVSLNDVCDSSPQLQIKGQPLGAYVITLPIGDHLVDIIASDKCGNESGLQLSIVVSDRELPALILKENLSISLSLQGGVWTNTLPVSIVDAGSHDHDCGPVSLTVARASELAMIRSAGGSLSIDTDMMNCRENLDEADKNKDGMIVEDEIYRDVIVFCCEDIGREVILHVRGQDLSGNISEAEITVSVSADVDWVPCDDDNICTSDDRQYGDCPCSGMPILSDIDMDDILDCSDTAIMLCLDGESLSVSYDEVSSLLSLGATGGPCQDGDVASISGRTYTIGGDMIEYVTISSGSRSELTNVAGEYLFADKELYNSYVLQPSLDEDYVNGLSVSDLIILEDYVLGIRVPDNPFLRIAADINDDGRISALDLQQLRLLLLGHTEGFSNQSWRFVVVGYEFIDENKPYDFEDVIYINNLQEDVADQDWIGIKIGDLNSTARANSGKSLSRSDTRYTLKIPDMQVDRGDEIEVPISISEELSIRGIQFELELEDMVIESIEGLPVSSYQYDEDLGRLRIVWHDDDLYDGPYLAKLLLKANRSTQLSKSIDLNYVITPEVVFENQEKGSLAIEFEDGLSNQAPSDVQLYQNQPNPFTGETVIQFEIPDAGEVDLSFFDASGRFIYGVTGQYGQGVNAVQLTRSDLRQLEGVILYRLKYRDQVITRKMVIQH